MDLFKKIKNYTYNQRHCLGEGSFGRVFQGKSEEGFKVAIKKVQQRMINKDKYLRDALETQISIMKKLNHKNIVKLYDLVLTANSIYLIMEFCGGGDLKRYCRNRKLPEEQAYRIIMQICKGFQEIVKLGILHRDLKPANILVHEGVFKICDFGFAKYFTDTTKMAKTCVGTPIYMSPQVLNQKSYTNKTDIWSLGILYFQLLFGRLPYYGSSENQLYRNIIKEGLSLPNCSKNCAYLLKGMLQIQQIKRFDWNKLFEHFQLGQIDDPKKQFSPISPHPPRQKTQLITASYQEPQPQYPQQQIYPQQQYQNFIVPDNKRTNEQPPKPIKNYLRQQILNDDEPQSDRKIPQRKPRNPLAFQNIPSQAPQNLGSIYKIPDEKPQNTILQKQCRFFYFVLIQLIVNPIDNCQNYPKLISSLYRETIQIYQSAIKQHKGNSLYNKVLASQLQQIKSLSSQIPNYASSNLKQSSQALIKQSNTKNNLNNVIKSPQIKWLQKILTKDYSYQNGSNNNIR